MRFEIRMQTAGAHRIDAEYFVIDENGVLLLHNDHGRRVAAVAPGAWASVQVINDEKEPA